MAMSHNDTVPLHPSSQSDIDEIENLINAAPATVLPARPQSPPRASIPVSSSPFIQSNIPPPSFHNKPPIPPPVSSASVSPAVLPVTDPNVRPTVSAEGFGPAPNTLTEPVWDTVKRDLSRIVSNLKLVVFPNPFREDPGKALRDWDLWGPFFFIVFLGLVLSWSASVRKKHRIDFCKMEWELRIKEKDVQTKNYFDKQHLIKWLTSKCNHAHENRNSYPSTHGFEESSRGKEFFYEVKIPLI